MSRILHDKNLSAKLDALFDIGRDFAQVLLIRWLESHQSSDQGETSTRIVKEIAPAQGDGRELLTTAELARRISYSTRQIQTFKLEGMPFIGEGRNTRFKLNEVVAWLDQRQRTHQGKNNRVSTGANGKVPQAPIKTRLQASQRR